MILYPNAKINIGLNITNKRNDGFHSIETVFYPIPLSDILEINVSAVELGYKNTGLLIENGKLENNICFNAYNILKEDFSLPPVQIHLHKIIPTGAGLGGGSSDASFTLKALNDLFKLKISENKLINYADQIGSDCPFFIRNQPVFANEKGNKLKSIELSLKGYYLVVVHPGIHINTAMAYSMAIPKTPSIPLTELIARPIESWKESIKNDFEEILFIPHPEIEILKTLLYKLGAVYASMSGSGSAVFGIFKDKVNINEQFNNNFVWSGLL